MKTKAKFTGYKTKVGKSSCFRIPKVVADMLDSNTLYAVQVFELDWSIDEQKQEVKQ